MPPSIDYKQQPTETPDTSILALLPLFSYISSVGFVSLLVAWLAIVFPWGGGSVAGGFTVLFYFTVTASLYALMRGYSEIFKRGLGGWDIFMWAFS